MGRVGTRYGRSAAVGAVQEKHCLNGCASPHSAELAQMAVSTALSLLRWCAEQLSLERPAWEASAVCGRSCDIVRLNVCRRMRERTNHKASTWCWCTYAACGRTVESKSNVFKGKESNYWKRVLEFLCMCAYFSRTQSKKSFWIN